MKIAKRFFLLLSLFFVSIFVFSITLASPVKATHEWGCSMFDFIDNSCSSPLFSSTFCSTFDQSSGCIDDPDNGSFRTICASSSTCGVHTPTSVPPPPYGTPSYGTPSYGTPSYNTPSYGTPSVPTPISANCTSSGGICTGNPPGCPAGKSSIPSSECGATQLCCVPGFPVPTPVCLQATEGCVPGVGLPCCSPNINICNPISLTCSPPTTTGGPTPPPAPFCSAIQCQKDGELCPSSCGVCDKPAFFSPGKCVDPATFCTFFRGSNCLLKNGDADCRDGSTGCANYSCWPNNKIIGTCKLGKPPNLTPFASPTPTPSITPVPDAPDDFAHCSGWGDKDGKPIKANDLAKFKDSKGNLRIKDNQLRCLEVNTAIGPVGTESKAFVARIFSLVLGLAGGIALILIMVSGYKFMTSGGNPESFQAARDMFVSAIVGLLFIIFAFVILQIIGVDILHIPGFG